MSGPYIIEGNSKVSEALKSRISDETFDEFLAEQGLLGEAQDVAIKRVLAWQIAEAMKVSWTDGQSNPAPTAS
jgi:hypothetical protein